MDIKSVTTGNHIYTTGSKKPGVSENSGLKDSANIVGQNTITPQENLKNSKLAAIKGKIDQNFYNTPEVLNKIVEKILPELQ